MRTSVFGALFGEKEARPSGEAAHASTLADQLAALRAALDMKDRSLERLREEQRMFLNENDALRAVYLERTAEALALTKEIERLQQQHAVPAPAACALLPCPDRVAPASDPCAGPCGARKAEDK